jgi:hypothetical protein
MSATEVHNTSRDASVGKVDMHLEIEIIPVSDVGRIPNGRAGRGRSLGCRVPLSLRQRDANPPAPC